MGMLQKERGGLWISCESPQMVPQPPGIPKGAEASRICVPNHAGTRGEEVDAVYQVVQSPVRLLFFRYSGNLGFCNGAESRPTEDANIFEILFRTC